MEFFPFQKQGFPITAALLPANHGLPCSKPRLRLTLGLLLLLRANYCSIAFIAMDAASVQPIRRNATVRRRQSVQGFDDQADAENNKQQWKIHWVQPTMMLMCYCLAMIAGFGHHLYYSYLKGRLAEHQRVRHGHSKRFITPPSQC
jgi:hypothetical protein